MQQYTNKLEERTLDFARRTIQLIKTLPLTLINKGTFSQLLRSSSSIGANYREASEAESRADFIHKIGICKKEARETIYWLELLATSNPLKGGEMSYLKDEALQFTKIFASSILTAKNNKI